MSSRVRASTEHVGFGDCIDELPLLIEAVNFFAGINFYLHSIYVSLF